MSLKNKEFMNCLQIDILGLIIKQLIIRHTQKHHYYCFLQAIRTKYRSQSQQLAVDNDVLYQLCILLSVYQSPDCYFY